MIYFRNINNDYNSFSYLVDFYNQHREKALQTIDVSFEEVTWIAANTCAIIGALFEKLTNAFNKVYIHRIDDEKVKDILARNGFLAFLGHEKMYDSKGTTIQFLKLSSRDSRFFSNYIRDELLGKEAMPHMSDRLKKKIAEGIYEIFMNAAMHSETKEGIFTCGQFFPHKNTIEFTVVDLGIGIKNRVNRHLNDSRSAVAAIEWAMEERHTTKGMDSGGLGLSILKEFISLNQGRIQVISNDGFWELKEGQINKNHFKEEFPGTAVNICFNTSDPMHYMLYEETFEDEEIF